MTTVENLPGGDLASNVGDRVTGVDELPDGEAARGSGQGIDGVNGDANRDGNGPPPEGHEDLQDDLGADPATG